ncbi:Hypothetical predicted protein, partial [Paramuricea clavata]
MIQEITKSSPVEVEGEIHRNSLVNRRVNTRLYEHNDDEDEVEKIFEETNLLQR